MVTSLKKILLCALLASLKAGMTYVNDKTYLAAGYQAGRWEGLAHFDENGFQGATLMYTIKEW